MRFRFLTLCVALTLACAGAALAQDTIVRCESNDGQRRFCDVGPNREIRFSRQASESPCDQGRTYGIERNRVWVDRGCRAEFAVFGEGPGGPGPGNGDRARDWGRGRDYGRGTGQFATVRCESQDMGPRSCSAPGPIRRARVERQLSESECRLGYSWKYTRNGAIWVSRGCRAEFEVELAQ